MRIEKKVWSKYFQLILEGKKTYELRLADWNCEIGDILILKEWNPETKTYTGRILEKQVTYIGKTKNIKFWNEKEINKYGFQIISFN